MEPYNVMDEFKAKEKMQSLASHILELCEKQGFTELEVRNLPKALETQLFRMEHEKQKYTKFHLPDQSKE